MSRCGWQATLPGRLSAPTRPLGIATPSARPFRRRTRARGHDIDGVGGVDSNGHTGSQDSAARTLSITFLPSQTVTKATPGLMLAQVAEDAGVPINVGCGEGQCGACEVEVKKEGGAGDAFVVRSCVTPVPRTELIAEQGEHWEVSTEFDFGSVW